MWQIVFVGSRSNKEYCFIDVLYLFHFISENEIIYILMYFIETHQLG